MFTDKPAEGAANQQEIHFKERGDERKEQVDVKKETFVFSSAETMQTMNRADKNASSEER